LRTFRPEAGREHNPSLASMQVGFIALRSEETKHS